MTRGRDFAAPFILQIRAFQQAAGPPIRRVMSGLRLLADLVGSDDHICMVLAISRIAQMRRNVIGIKGISRRRYSV